MRALIDPGSQSAFITEQVTQLLKVPRFKISATINGIGESSKTEKSSLVITVYSRLTDDFNLSTEAIVLNKLTNFSMCMGDFCNYEHLKNLKFADTVMDKNAPIDIILGVVEHALKMSKVPFR